MPILITSLTYGSARDATQFSAGWEIIEKRDRQTKTKYRKKNHIELTDEDTNDKNDIIFVVCSAPYHVTAQ